MLNEAVEGQDFNLLRPIGPGAIWVAALLATLLSLNSLYREDFEDGSLEQLLLSPQPLYLSVLAYIAAHWIITGLLLSAVCPLFALMLNLPTAAIGALCPSDHRSCESFVS